MTQPIETFADVLHSLVDTVLAGDVATKAHAVIDASSGLRTPAEPEEVSGDVSGLSAESTEAVTPTE